MPAQEVLNREGRLVILGDPGSGKSTFVKHVAHTLAQARLSDDPERWLGRMAPWDHGLCLPVHVELRALAAYAEQVEQKGRPLLLGYLRHALAERQLEAAWPVLNAALRDEQQTLLVLFDGLDEVPADRRAEIVGAVQDLADQYRSHRYVVTCRPYAYVGQPCQLRRFREVTLAPFDGDQIDRFIATWYRELVRRHRLAASKAEQQAGQLQRAVRRGDLRGLAGRPLLLTAMTLLHTFRGQLPQDRTELYASTVDLLLRRWEGRVGVEEGVLEQLDVPGLKMSDLEAGLYAVAFYAHSKAGQDDGASTADIDEGDLRKWLAPYLGESWDKAGDFVAYIRERAGLLIRHKPQAYTFPHRTFQEFMAACHLVGLADYPRQAARLARDDPARWPVVFVLAAGHAARTHRLGQAVAAVNALCPRAVGEVGAPGQQALLNARLAGEALLEIGLVGVRREEVGRALLERVQRWLAAGLRADRTLAPAERAALGNTLARLGDPRPGVVPVIEREGDIPLVETEFCLVPAGPFWMGSDEDDKIARDSEKPLHRVDLTYDYWITRYPVTVAQFQIFVRVSGFRPGDMDSLRGLVNHPVVWVSWEETCVFCHWLTECWREAGLLPEGWQITLPSEAEWEKGARGGVQVPEKPLIVAARTRSWAQQCISLIPNPKSRRRYPWGNDLDPNRANYSDTGIGQTNAVGCFPGGTSLYGVEEQSGTVWEWTRSQWKAYPYELGDGREDMETGVRRVVRGGAFDSSAINVRCAARGNLNPSYRLRYVGFRLVASPVLPR